MPRPGRARSARVRRPSAGSPTPTLVATRGPQATPDEVDVASEDHRAADEAVDTVEAVEPEADVTVRPETEPAAPVAARIGELPPAVPDPSAGLPNAAGPVLDPDAPDAPQRRHPRPAGVGGGAGVGPRPPPWSPSSGRRTGRRAGPTQPPTAAAVATGPDRRRRGAGRRTGRRTGRRHRPARWTLVGAGSATSDGAGAVTGDPTGVRRTAARAPDGSEPIAGSNGVGRPAAPTPR